MSEVSREASEPTFDELRALPEEEQDQVLEAQAERMAPFYQADLALPSAEREMTASAAIQEDFIEPAEYLHHATSW